ncbi:sugar transferase [Agromyces atrinae]|uniref:sugar transferase n=1 Tax=Agromyces atrinae TaxID=592376 RepID=UPI001F59DD62|nr:sugar transferase [Agromyces atrinae]MCI2956164.1 sugar transferase [Agromyces atrinae]
MSTHAWSPAPQLPDLRIVSPLGADATAPIAVVSPKTGVRWARRYRTQVRATDIGVILLAITASYVVTVGGVLTADGVLTALLFGAAWAIALDLQRTRDPRIVGIGAAEYKSVVNASALAFGAIAVIVAIVQVPDTRFYFMFALPAGIVVLLVERWLWRHWLHRQRANGHYVSRSIVVGNRCDVEYVVGQLDKHSGAGYAVVGAALIDDERHAVVAGRLAVPVVSGIDGVADAARQIGADAVIVAGQPAEGGDFIRHLGWELERTDAELVLSSRLADIAGPRIHLRPVEGMPLIHVEIPHFSGGKHVFKRLVDVVLSSVALVVLLPVLLGIAALVRLDSPGPVLFKQRRVGRQGETFEMLKFRSMVPTAERDLDGLLDRSDGNGVLFKMRNDPRVTRIGRVLRRYSLDELPQIWNILVGHMSVVGPRPPLPTEVEAYTGHVERRLFIKPGLTGMWQINGRSELSWDESVRLDLYYVENWSLTGDLMIIWRTFKTVIRPTGAY